MYQFGRSKQYQPDIRSEAFSVHVLLHIKQQDSLKQKQPSTDRFPAHPFVTTLQQIKIGNLLCSSLK
jgi:hypothetical protein